ncbi:hypothetical protein [Phyllobacterium sp. K27]
MTEKLNWTRAQIRSAAIMAKEQNVAIRLNADGSLQVSPYEPKDAPAAVEPTKTKVIRM